MKNLLLQLFTWWNGQTLGTRFFTWRYGKKVGKDEFGNIYYEGGKNTSLNLPRRWVIFKGYTEATAVPPGWHGWLHYTTNILPNQEDYKAAKWQKPHKQNLTGTPKAYYPIKFLFTTEKQVTFPKNYKAWSPNNDKDVNTM